MKMLASVIMLLMIVGTISSASWKNQQGVANKWRDESGPRIEIGKTHQTEIAKLLGPPSQIIGLDDQIIFYYLLEKKVGKGAFFILFNWSNEKVTYDRAIFFFDKNGLLNDYAYSLEKVPYETPQ
jgi:hypothetical protein